MPRRSGGNAIHGASVEPPKGAELRAISGQYSWHNTSQTPNASPALGAAKQLSNDRHTLPLPRPWAQLDPQGAGAPPRAEHPASARHDTPSKASTFTSAAHQSRTRAHLARLRVRPLAADKRAKSAATDGRLAHKLARTIAKLSMLHGRCEKIGEDHRTWTIYAVRRTRSTRESTSSWRRRRFMQRTQRCTRSWGAPAWSRSSRRSPRPPPRQTAATTRSPSTTRK